MCVYIYNTYIYTWLVTCRGRLRVLPPGPLCSEQTSTLLTKPLCYYLNHFTLRTKPLIRLINISWSPPCTSIGVYAACLLSCNNWQTGSVCSPPACFRLEVRPHSLSTVESQHTSAYVSMLPVCQLPYRGSSALCRDERVPPSACRQRMLTYATLSYADVR